MVFTILSPISKLQHAPLPLKVLQARERASTPYPSVVFSLDSHFESIKELGGVSPIMKV